MSEHNLVIPEADWRKLLASAKGDDALLYLYLRVGGQAEQAESALHMTRSRLECAEASLRSIGLWPEKPKVLRPAEPPAYTEADLIREMKEDHRLFPAPGGDPAAAGQGAQHRRNSKILLSIYNYLGLPAEVISILISLLHAARQGQEAPAARPPCAPLRRRHTIGPTRASRRWRRRRAYVQLEMEKQTKLRAMQRALQINDRPAGAGGGGHPPPVDRLGLWLRGDRPGLRAHLFCRSARSNGRT